MAIEAGRLLDHRYRLIRPVGQGSQASVWVAEHLALTTHVAVKLIDPELAKKESARERFRREATAAAQLRSAHVVQILDHGIDGDQPYIVMELLDGEDLFERLAHRIRLSLRETSKIVTQVARALSRAHAAGIVHRDLKPENVFLCPNEDDEVVKVLDFGVAKVKDAARVTMQKTNVGTLIGTPHYMSPEQVKGIGDIDFRTDLWALGIIAFQCVTGEMPFDSEGVGDLLIKISMGEMPVPSKMWRAVPAPFDVWFAKACDRDADKRFQSARELALALVAVVNQVDGTVPRPPTVRPQLATLPGLTSVVPAAPRMPSGMSAAAAAEELGDSVDLEELYPFDEDEDDRPTRMKAAPEPLPAARAPAPAAPRPSAGASKAQVRPNTSIGLAPPRTASVPRMAAVTPQTPAPQSPRAPQAPHAPHVPPRATPAVRPAAPPPPTPVPIIEAPPQETHDIVDFDETIPATEAMEARLSHAGFPLVVRANAAPASAPAAALMPLSEPPRAPSPLPPQDDSASRAILAPVMASPPRAIAPSPPHEDHPPVSVRQPPPRPPPPSAPVTMGEAAKPPAPAPVSASQSNLESTLMITPPELDGSSKRRRMVRFMVAGLVIFAVGITWTVVRSQFDGMSSGAVMPTDTPTTTSAPPPVEVPSTTATMTATAVDPGKVTRPTKPPPTFRGPSTAKPIRPRKNTQPDDGTILVPHPPDDGVPPAP